MLQWTECKLSDENWYFAICAHGTSSPSAWSGPRSYCSIVAFFVDCCIRSFLQDHIRSSFGSPATGNYFDLQINLALTLNISVVVKVRVMRPLDSATTFNFTPYTVSIYDSVLVRLKAADLDQEVKERAISCMGFIVSHLGDHLAG